MLIKNNGFFALCDTASSLFLFLLVTFLFFFLPVQAVFLPQCNHITYRWERVVPLVCLLQAIKCNVPYSLYAGDIRLILLSYCCSKGSHSYDDTLVRYYSWMCNSANVNDPIYFRVRELTYYNVKMVVDLKCFRLSKKKVLS